MPETINPRALLLEQIEVLVSIQVSSATGHGYTHIRATLGQSQWAGVIPAGQVTGQTNEEGGEDA